MVGGKAFFRMANWKEKRSLRQNNDVAAADGLVVVADKVIIAHYTCQRVLQWSKSTTIPLR